MRKSFFLFSLVCFSAQAQDLASCYKVEFQMDFWSRDKQMITVGKNACKVKLVHFAGSSEKWLVDICNPKIAIETYSPIDAKEPVLHFAGSKQCRHPLFGADFNKSKGKNQFTELREKLFDYLLQARSDNPKDQDAKLINEQLKCVQQLLTEYLENCKSFTSSSGPGQ